MHIHQPFSGELLIPTLVILFGADILLAGSRLPAFSRQHPMEPEATDLNRLVAGLNNLLPCTLGETAHFDII